MLVPKRSWDFCVSEIAKKEIYPIFIEELKKVCIGSINYGGIETFC